MSQVAIRNPTTGGVAVQSQEQFDTLYAARGWEIVDVNPAFATEAVGVTINDLSELSLDQLASVVAAHDAPDVRKTELLAKKADELRDLAEVQGLSTSGTKEELADRLIEHEDSLS